MNTDTTETDDIIIDEALRALIPPLTDEEAALLEESIAREGCKQPLALWDRTLIDGHHRHAICTRLGVPYRTEQVPGLETRDDVVVWMARTQLGRRNASAFVRAELALSMKAALARQAKARQGARTDLDIRAELPGSQTRDALAAEAGISARNVSKVERVLADGVLELIERARTGDVSINLAERIARRAPAFQRAALESHDPALALIAFDGGLAIEPAIRDVLPPLKAVELAGLERGIAEDGKARVPLAVFGGVLVDGHERYRLCRELGVPFTLRNAPDRVSSVDEAIEWRVEQQLARKNLTPDQVRLILGQGYNRRQGKEAAPVPELILDGRVLGAIPPLAFEELQALERDLLVRGCREPLLVWEGPSGPVLVDGLARYTLCHRHGVAFTTRTAKGADSLEAAKAHRAALPIFESGLALEEEAQAHAKAAHFIAAHVRHPFARTDDDGRVWRMSPGAQRRRVRWLLEEYDATHTVELA